MAISSGTGQQIFASRHCHAVPSDIIDGIICFTMADNVRLSRFVIIKNCAQGNERKWEDCTSKTSCDFVKSSIEFCIADRTPRLIFRDQMGSSTDGHMCSICPSWNENRSGWCSSPAAKLAEPSVIVLDDPSCGSDCSRLTRLS